MKLLSAVTLLFAGSFSAPAFAQSALDIARERDACKGRVVLEARFESENRIVVRCSNEALPVPPGAGEAAAAGAAATNVVPLIGGLGPVLGIGAAAAGVAAISGGGSSSDTQ